MCLIKYHILIYFAIILDLCFALNCRSDSGPKEAELKNIYMTCLRKQEGKNSSSHRGYGDDGWKEPRGYNQRSQWDREDRMNGRDDKMNGRDGMNGRDDRMSNRDDRYSDRDDQMGGRDDKTSRDRMGSRDDRYSDRDDQMNGREDRLSRDRMGGRDDRMNNRDDRMAGRNGMGRNDMTSTGFGRSDLSGREDFAMNDDFGSFSEMGYKYRSTTQAPHRFKREKRVEINSGQRSQYNPYHSSTQRTNYEDNSNKNDDRNSSENNSSKSKDMDKKACALHCFLENMEMIGDDGMPDRYLVTHAITKDVKDEDLKDFLQESIEECFQILDNENTENKCEFSKNLMMCLSEKGRANCDDWKDDLQLHI